MSRTIQLPVGTTSSDLPAGWRIGAHFRGSEYHLIHEGDSRDYYAVFRPDLSLISGEAGTHEVTRFDIAERLAALAEDETDEVES